MDLKTPGIILISGTAGSRCSKWCHNWLPSPSPPPQSLLLSDSGFLLCGFCFSDRFSHEDSPAAPGLNVPQVAISKREKSLFCRYSHWTPLQRSQLALFGLYDFPQAHHCLQELCLLWGGCGGLLSDGSALEVSESQCCVPKCSKPFLVRVMGS